MPESKQSVCGMETGWRGVTWQQKPRWTEGDNAVAVRQESNAGFEKGKGRPQVKSVLQSWEKSICILLAGT